MIPESVTVNTGEEGPVHQTIDRFFQETAEIVKGKYCAHTFDFQIKCGCVAVASDYVIDDAVHYLLYRQQVIACVMETRTEFNYVHYDFFRNLDDLKDERQKR